MSRTYPPAAEADPQAAERERTRQMTRELHEAAQEARAAARELRAEQAAAAAAIEKRFKLATAEATTAIDRYAAEHTRELGRQLHTVTEQLNSVYEGFLARLGELADTDMDQEGIEKFMQLAVLRATSSREFITRVVDVMAEEISADPRLCTPRPRPGGGQVLVATPEALAAFRRAGGDPGIVLDART